jgi:hypothetical protein
MAETEDKSGAGAAVPAERDDVDADSDRGAYEVVLDAEGKRDYGVQAGGDAGDAGAREVFGEGADQGVAAFSVRTLAKSQLPVISSGA